MGKSRKDLNGGLLRKEVFDLIYDDPDIDSGINAALACVGEGFGISRVYIFENNEANTHSNNTFEWCADGIEPQMELLQNMSFEEYDYQSLFDEQGLCFCPDVSQLPDMLRDLFEGQGIYATLQYAIYDKGIFRGFVGFDDCEQARHDWQEDKDSADTLIYISRLMSICLLKERNLQRTQQLHAELQESLALERASREEALKANEAKSRFLSNVSHDMRTPLNGIIGFTRLALEAPSAEEKDDCLKKIETSGHFLANLINETLDLSKIETGKVTLRPEPVDSRSLLNSIVMNIKGTADAKNITLNIDTTRAKWTVVNVDVLRMQEIFSNLLSNAVKFTPENGRIDFIVECVAEQNGMLEEKIIVRDNGIGMSPDFVKVAFEPFSQENPLESNNFDGTGLGLSIVQQLVRLMHGRIELHSEIGQGAEFVVYLEMPVAMEEEQSHGPDFLIEKDLSDLRVLVCEDHPINAELIKRLLVKKNMQPSFAKDGEQGVELFRQSEPGFYAAILMDIRLPKIDGLEAARQIRRLSHPDASRIPIIAMTANAYEEDQRAALAAGMNAHLAKPIDPAKLYKMIQKMVFPEEVGTSFEEGEASVFLCRG